MKAFLLIFLYFLLKLTNFLWFIGNKKIPNKQNASEWLHSKYSNFRSSHWRCSSKSVFLTKQNRCSHRKAPVLESRYNIFAGLKKTLSQFFPIKFAKVLKHLFLQSIFFTEHLRTTASVTIIETDRSSHQRCSVRKGVLANFATFTEKHLSQSLFFNKFAGLRLTFSCYFLNDVAGYHESAKTHNMSWITRVTDKNLKNIFYWIYISIFNEISLVLVTRVLSNNWQKHVWKIPASLSTDSN